jgi:hypothetical protein
MIVPYKEESFAIREGLMASVMAAAKLAALLKSSDPKGVMHVQVLGDRVVLGVNPSQPTHMVDFSNERVVPYAASAIQTSSSEMPSSNGVKFPRRSGDYWFEIKGKRTECGSLKELLAEALKVLERTKPGTLDSLSRIRGRSRRIVARDPGQLFDKPRLVKKYAEKLNGGWYYGTNNSARETGVWLERGAECAGLTLGSDFIISLNVGPALVDL